MLARALIRKLLVFGLAFLFCGLAMPSALLAQPEVCVTADALDPDEEVAASPRGNYTAEYLSLWGSDGAAADTALYEVIVSDLAAIEEILPAIGDMSVQLDPPTGTIFVDFGDEATLIRAQNGEIEAYECLNEIFDLDDTIYYPNALPTWAVLRFAEVLDSDVLRELYGSLPEVVQTDTDVSLIPINGCYYSPDGHRRVYLLEELGFFFPTFPTLRWFRIEVGGSGIEIEEVDEGPPPWDDEYQSCLAGELDGHLIGTGPTVPAIPTASDFGLLALTLLLGLVGWRAIAGGGA